MNAVFGRRHAMFTLLCGLGLATASCNGSLTSPSSFPSASPSESTLTARASAGATQLRFAVDLTVPAFPVCPFTPPSAGALTGTGVLTVVIRTTEDASGGTHIGSTIHGHGTATDANGRRWVWSDADLNNELFPSGNTSDHSFSQTIREGFHAIGPKGEKVMVMGTFHVTQVNGSTVVEFEKGNHEDGEVCESGFVLTPLP